MTDLPKATRIARAGDWSGAADAVVLDYEGRFLRRRRITATGGLSFLVDLPETAGLGEGDAFALEDGRFVEVRAADEQLYHLTGDLARLAWHIGNRHAPCEIGVNRLTIRRDPVLGGMLEGLGAELAEAEGPFRPEGGAYAIGQVLGHDTASGHALVAHHGYRHHLSEEDGDEGDDDAADAAGRLP